MLTNLITAAVAAYIPVAGTIANSTIAYSTSFRITNLTSHHQLVRADWLASNGRGSQANALQIDLAPNEVRMIASVFPFAGFPPSLGAVKLVAVTENGATDDSASIEASALISGTRLTDSARLTQDVPGILGPDMRGSEPEGLIFWPALVPAFLPEGAPRPRSNYGIVNDANEPNTFVIQTRFPVHGIVLANPREETVVVPPHAMVQRQLLANGSPVDDEGAIVTIRRVSASSGVWTAYVSNVDSSTGDAVMVPALPRSGKLTIEAQ